MQIVRVAGLSLMAMSPLFVHGQGFPPSPIDWSLPSGGLAYGGVTYGYNSMGESGAYTFDTGSENWATFDINGDARPDLVIPSARNANGNATEFSPASNSYWKVYLNTGSGFSTSSTNWSLPGGGLAYGGVTYGYNSIAESGAYTFDTGSENWATFDINGDARPDLVIPSARNANGNATEFSPASNSYWKVYLNTGSGFSTSPTNWSLPNGGLAYGGVTYGYNSTAESGAYTFDTGSENWATFDINGDARPDLVIPSARNANGNATEFSPASNSYWKVYLNTGSGFSTSPINWSLPSGGLAYGGVTYGYNSTAESGAYTFDTGSENWATLDINGDARPDLVIPSARNANGNATEFSPTSNSYWKVYLNTGSGFSTSPTNWSLPSGGLAYGGVTYGYNSIAESGAYTFDTGSENWAVVDMNGDARLDLVIPSARNANGNATEFSPASNSYWKVYMDQSSTDVTDLAPADGSTVHPNPADGYVMLSGIAPLGTVHVCDMNGRIVRELTANAARTSLDVHDLPAGVYVLRMQCGSDLRMQRLVVAH